MPFQPVDYDPFANDDQMSQAAGAQTASDVGDYLSHTFDQLGGSTYDPNRSFAQNALDPQGIKNAMGIALAFGPGAIKGYHGSPYNFDAFDASKIGTGEGAQSYGHGLYFAENQGVAQSYRDALSAPVTNDYLLSDNSGKIPDWAGNQIVQYPPGHQYYNDVIDRLTNLFHSRIAEQDAQWSSQPWMADANKQGLQEIVDNLGRLKSGEVTLEKPQPTGKMYEVNIDAHPDTFLDWDKPLGEQSDQVKQALSGFGIKPPEAHYTIQNTPEGFAVNYLDNAGKLQTASRVFPTMEEATNAANQTMNMMNRNPTGGQMYESSKIVPGDYRDPAAASIALRNAGISGVKYLDQGSRAAGEGTSNFVVFDPKMIEIVKKYGLAPLVAGGAMTLSGNADAATHAIPTEHNPFTVPVDYDPFAAGGF